MKTKILLFLLALISSISYAQIIPLDHTAPDADNLKQAAVKINANDAYLDTMGVQRLDSLIAAGVGSSVTASNGLTMVGDDIQLGGTIGINTSLSGGSFSLNNSIVSFNGDGGQPFSVTSGSFLMGQGSLDINKDYVNLKFTDSELNEYGVFFDSTRFEFNTGPFPIIPTVNTRPLWLMSDNQQIAFQTDFTVNDGIAFSMFGPTQDWGFTLDGTSDFMGLYASTGASLEFNNLGIGINGIDADNTATSFLVRDATTGGIKTSVKKEFDRVVAGGSANSATATVPGLTALVAGQRFNIEFPLANTAGVSLNINGLGSKQVLKDGNPKRALSAGDIVPGTLLNLSYDGNYYHIEGIISREDVLKTSGLNTVTGTGGWTLQSDISDNKAITLQDNGATLSNITLSSPEADNARVSIDVSDAFFSSFCLITVDSRTDANGGITLATNNITIKLANDGNVLKITGLPTSSPCATAGSNTVWNDAGALKICP